MQTKQFGSVEAVNITILVDNRADLMVKSSDKIKYFTDKPLLAEHGFSALMEFPETGQRILWDAGISNTALMENLRRMEIDPGTVSLIALSHGHRDHFAALTDFIKAMGREVESKEWGQEVNAAEVEAWIAAQQVPVVAHPAAFRERWWVKDDGTKVGPHSPPPWKEWEAIGAKMVLSADPYQLGPGCWTTGYVPRKSFETSGRPDPGRLLFREGEDLRPDDIEEDQAIAIHLTGKGLVVLSGCAHAGIVNTIRQAQEISGVERVHAVLGGFHLGRSEEADIQATIEAVKELNPGILAPCHCTGFQAMAMFARAFPDSFKPAVVGATFLL